MTARLLALATLLPLAACAAPVDSPPASGGAPEADAPEAPTLGDTPEARARAAGLSAEHAREIASLRAPVLLPAHMDGWAVDRVQTNAPMMGDMPTGIVSYLVRWRRADGACVEISGSNDGLGGPDYPSVSTSVTLARLPGAPEAALYRADDDPDATSAQMWGAGTVLSDYVELGGEASFLAVWLLSNSASGCRPLALDEAVAVLARLRPLRDGAVRTAGAETGDGQDPVWTDPELGDFLFDDSVTGDAMQGDPEAAVRAWMASPELGAPEIRVLSRTPDEVRILATRTDLPDDSIRGERSLFVFRRQDGQMQFFVSALQFRCWPDRGPQDWSAEGCY